MASEVFSAKESSVNSLNAVSSSASRQANPFRSITTRPISAAYRAELEAEGVNMRIYEQTRVDERNRRIDGEYERQVRQLKLDLGEKYPIASYADRSGDKSISVAQAERRAYNRELNQGVRRLKRLAAAAKRK